MVVPEGSERAIERLQQNLTISVPTLSQHAALGALEAGEELEGYRKVYRANRTMLLEALPKIGFDRLVPADGAFYLYCDVSDMTNDSSAMSRRILDEAGVAVTPGLDFDAERGNRFLRFSYAGTEADMREAVERLGRWLESA